MLVACVNNTRVRLLLVGFCNMDSDEKREKYSDLRTFQNDVWRIHSMAVRPLALVYQIVERTP